MEGLEETHTSFSCAFRGAASAHYSGSCTVTVQRDVDSDKSVVCMLACPPARKLQVGVVSLTINVHEGDDT